MRNVNRYLFSLTLIYALTTFILAFFPSDGLGVFLSVYIVEYFILTPLFSPFNPKTQKITNLIGYGLFVLFIFIVAVKVLEILGTGLI